jgi:hypothetical protein
MACVLAGQLKPQAVVVEHEQPVHESGAAGQLQLLPQVMVWQLLKQPAEVLEPGAQAPWPPQAP